MGVLISSWYIYLYRTILSAMYGSLVLLMHSCMDLLV
jgi:hypothetical protein